MCTRRKMGGEGRDLERNGNDGMVFSIYKLALLLPMPACVIGNRLSKKLKHYVNRNFIKHNNEQ